MLNLKNLSMSTTVAAMTLGTLLIGTVEPTNAASLTGTINLLTGTVSGNLPNNSISFVQSPTVGIGGYYETVLKINLDPVNLFTKAIFDVKYDANPNGMTVNIGDSATNDGHGGDGGTQSNDAEMQIGVAPNAPESNTQEFIQQRNDLIVFANDSYYSGAPSNPVARISDIVPSTTTSLANTIVSLVVSNGYLGWSNPQGVSGMLNNKYLYALAGQADSESPVNYDIFAGFNRSIGSPGRWGTGVSEVTITLSDDPISLAGEPVPEPMTLVGSCLALGVGGFLKKRHSNKQNQV